MSDTLRRLDPNTFANYKTTTSNGEITYSAGFPSYPRNFSRDVFTAGIIASSLNLLLSQLEMSAKHQGIKSDPITGELPGKIHHELPGVKLHEADDKYTTYNACDTTSLLLIAAEGLINLDPITLNGFLTRRERVLERAVEYIMAQVGEDSLFRDAPPTGANSFALRVTYWKDSILPEASGKTQPEYPVHFPQAHFIAARGLLSAAKLLRDQNLDKLADKMFQAGIKNNMTADFFTVYSDRVAELRQASSDELHSLAYIPAEYADLLPLEAISERAAEHLTTPFGYICTPIEIAETLTDKYHGDKVWIFEQANIHYGAVKFNLKKEKDTAAAVVNHIKTGQELLGIKYGDSGQMHPVPEGNNRQLWSVAAGEYFAKRSLLNETAWL